MGIKQRLITTERGHLFRIANILSTAFPVSVLSDPDDPVIITVCGSYGAGKKIFADAIRNRLLPDKKQRHFTGRENYDECWTGLAAGTSLKPPLQITFLNAAWAKGYADRDMADITICQRAAHFEKSRRHGGVSLVHNDRFYAAQKAWVNIWVETLAGDILDYPPRPHIKNTGAEVRHTFNTLARKKPWTRYIEIDINHPRLLAAPQTQDALDRLTQGAADIYKLRDKRTPAYAYARKDPRMNALQRAALAMGWY